MRRGRCPLPGGVEAELPPASIAQASVAALRFRDCLFQSAGGVPRLDPSEGGQVTPAPAGGLL
jgi:hypothetical protein